MPEKILDLNRSVYELCTADEGILSLLAEIGFTDITEPGILATAGRLMTIPKGAALKGKDLSEIKRIFIGHGYRIKEESE